MSVWYIGQSDVRIVASEDWNEAGTDDGGAFQWDATNGYSYPETAFSAEQLAWLSSQPDFLVPAPDGPRTVAIVAPDGYITESRLRAILAGFDLSSLGLTKASIGLDHVDDTADADKPVSGPQQTALDAKADYPTGGTDGQVLVKAGTSTGWAAPGGSAGSVGVVAVADASLPSGQAYTISGSGVAAVADSSVPSGTVYTVN